MHMSSLPFLGVIIQYKVVDIVVESRARVMRLFPLSVP